MRGAGWGEAGVILHYLEAPEQAPDSGTEVELELDWDLRHRRMRMHTALHLLSVIVPCPVTGGAIGEEKSRLDFDMPEAPEKESLEARLNELVWRITRSARNGLERRSWRPGPDLVKTVGARPPETGGADPPGPDRGDRSAALRRHACPEHGRDRCAPDRQDREKGPRQPANQSAFCAVTRRRPGFRAGGEAGV